MISPEWLLVDDSGNDLLTFDTFVSMSVKGSGTVVSEPVENGSFVTYNKTSEPLTIDLTVGVGGDAEDLQSVIARLEELQTGAEVFSIVSPEKEYANFTLESYSYDRKRNEGHSVLWIDLHAVEIREVEPQYTTAKVIKPAAAKKADTVSAVDRGKVQTAKPQEESLLSKGLSAVRGGS